ncbi:hypothetical protein MBANPS3_008154 [Mucor bainieri]
MVSEFLSRLTALQVSSHQAMVGLSQCLGILQQAISNGAFSNSTSTLDLQLLDLDERGIFQGVDPIFFMDNLDELVPSYFIYHGFYRILCAAVGNIHPEKHSDKVMDLITEQLPQDMRVDFKTGYTLQASCRQFFTNFSNMWSQSKCRADLRVVLDLLLRMHLAQDRFFGPKKQRKKEVTADKTKTPRVHLKTHMDTLFWSIQQGKRADVINHWSELKTLEAHRRDAARLSRAHEKEHRSLDPELYGRLKDIRAQCNALYLDQQRLQHSKSQDQSNLYMLNKKIHGQAVVVSKPVPAPPSFGPNTKIQGVDPGVVTMASGVCSGQKPLFESINRYEALQDHQESIHHGMDQDAAFDMTAKIVNAAVNTKTLPANSPKKKQQKRVRSTPYHPTSAHTSLVTV